MAKLTGRDELIRWIDFTHALAHAICHFQTVVFRLVHFTEVIDALRRRVAESLMKEFCS